MKIGIAVLSEAQKQEITCKQISEGAAVQWVNSTAELVQIRDAEFWIDCTFSGNEIPYFEKPTLIHAPALILTNHTPERNVGRFCAWPTFLKREIWEISLADDSSNWWVEDLMKGLGRKYLLVKNEPGMIAPRIVCTIINEAYHALQAGVSSAEEIDVAMKLGTNYPYGPLEWSKLIGLEQVHKLLQLLTEKNSMYKPSFQIS